MTKRDDNSNMLPPPLSNNPNETWEQAWEQELLRRQELHEKGLTVFIPGPVAMAKLREQFR